MGLVQAVDKIEDAVERDVSKVKAELETLFGKDNIDKFLAAAEGFLKTEAGAIIKTAVTAAKTALPGGPGTALHAAAAAFSKSALESAGLAVSSQILNLGIETALSAL